MITLEDMRAQIIDIARHYSVTPNFDVHVARECGASYNNGHPSFNTMKIKSLLTYAIALHELGHCVTFNRAGYLYHLQAPGIRRLNAEALAWRWAQDNALVWERSMQLTYRYSARFYLRAANKWVQTGFMM